MDHRPRPDHTEPTPPAAAEEAKIAGIDPLRIRLSGYVSAAERAARGYLEALAQMQLATLLLADLRASGIEGGESPFGSADALAAEFRRFAKVAVEGYLIKPGDEVLARLIPTR